jgi:hypothetical protein
MEGGLSDIGLCFVFALALLALRVSLERRLLPPLRALLARAKGNADNAAVVFDDLFVALSAGALVVGGWAVMLRANGGCLPWAPSSCLQGWPDHPVSPDFRMIWIASAGFYLYEIVGTLLGVPLLSVEMMVHHVVTLSLMVSAVLLVLGWLVGFFCFFGFFPRRALSLLSDAERSQTPSK